MPKIQECWWLLHRFDVSVVAIRILCLKPGDVVWLPKGTLADVSRIAKFSPSVVVISFK